MRPDTEANKKLSCTAVISRHRRKFEIQALRGPFVHHLSHRRARRDGINEGAVTEGVGNVSCGLVPIDACNGPRCSLDDVRVGTLVHYGLVPGLIFFCGGCVKKERVSTMPSQLP